MLEVGWWGWGSLRDLSKNILKQGVGKGKSCSKEGGGFKGVTTQENFNHTPSRLQILKRNCQSRIWSVYGIEVNDKNLQGQSTKQRSVNATAPSALIHLTRINRW